MAGTGGGLLRSTFSRLRRLNKGLPGDDGDDTPESSPRYIAAKHTAAPPNAFVVVAPADDSSREDAYRDSPAECSGRHSGSDTALHLACGAGNLELVQQLLQDGVDVDARGAFGFTPLFWGSQSGHSGIVRTLIRGGAVVDAMDIHGSTPLLLAVVCGHLEIVLVLLAAGADPDAQGSCEPPIHCAVATGSVAILEALVSAGANTAIASPRDRKTALHAAVMANQLEIVQVLLAVNSPADARDDCLFTPLHFAAGRGSSDITRSLLMAGADVSARDVNSFTPLHLAAGGGHSGVVQLLLEHGADINSMTEPHGLVPIVLAAAGPYEDTTKVLLQAGAWVRFIEPPSGTTGDTTPTGGGGGHAVSISAAADVLEAHVANPLASHQQVKMHAVPHYQETIRSALEHLAISGLP